MGTTQENFSLQHIFKRSVSGGTISANKIVACQLPQKANFFFLFLENNFLVK
jgi:hypothetical protein